MLNINNNTDYDISDLADALGSVKDVILDNVTTQFGTLDGVVDAGIITVTDAITAT